MIPPIPTKSHCPYKSAIRWTFLSLKGSKVYQNEDSLVRSDYWLSFYLAPPTSKGSSSHLFFIDHTPFQSLHITFPACLSASFCPPHGVVQGLTCMFSRVLHLTFMQRLSCYFLMRGSSWWWHVLFRWSSALWLLAMQTVLLALHTFSQL
jgi:hypothetical protein